jgi:RNA methyltransferase, TrmH family
MLIKAQVKYIQSLGHKKFRDADAVFVAEGPKIVQELLQSDNVRLVQCFATEKWLLSNAGILKGKEELIIRTDDKELQRISFHQTPNQVLALFTKPVFEVAGKRPGLTLLLDTIQDPGNLGTILRTADWFGVKKIVCSLETVDVYNPKVVQSAMGSVIRVELIYTDLIGYINLHPGIPVYASSLEGQDLDENIAIPNLMLLLGNESMGINSVLESRASKKIRIPGKGGAESLNVAVAAGILLSRLKFS